MPIDSAEVTSRRSARTNRERGENLGDPREDDAAADAESPADEPKRAVVETAKAGKYGAGAEPVEGTSATNLRLPGADGGVKCGNPYTGYGICGGEIDEKAGRCKKCGIPTRGAIADAMAQMHFDGPDLGQVTAHEREAARLAITREVTERVFRAHGFDPDCAADQSTVPPHVRTKMRAVQAEIDRECLERFKSAGLLPRPIV